MDYTKGRNLLRKSSTFKSSDLTLVRSTVPGTGTLRITPTTSTAYGAFKVDYLTCALMMNHPLAISFEARLVEEGTYAGTTGTTRLYYGIRKASRSNNNLSSIYDRVTGPTIGGLSTEWNRFSITIENLDLTVLASGPTDYEIEDSDTFTIEAHCAAKGEPAEFRNFKIEFGTEATPWSPAPEDSGSLDWDWNTIARAPITITQERDIDSVWRFYKIAASTATPSKPTNAQGISFIKNHATLPTGWNLTDPSYDGTTTNSLYITDLTAFSDGTVSWSDVSKSSSYEAAKQAYNKADSAQTAAEKAQSDIDNLEIGGRNFLRRTADFNADYWLPYDMVIDDILDVDDPPVPGILKSGLSRGSYISLGQNLSLPAGQEYTVSWYARHISGDMDRRITAYLNLSTALSVPVDSSSWKHYSLTITPTGNSLYAFTLLAASGNGTIEICGLKLEKGNRATDWTPAPEDVSAEIEAAIDELEGTLKTQIDAKIETFATDEDPSIAWTTTALKDAHVGDLWYYTGKTGDIAGRTNNTTYEYVKSGTTYSWQVYSDATVDLFDRIDGKSTIYYGTPTAPTSTLYVGVEDGDYLVDETDGSTYRWDNTVADANKWVLATKTPGRNLLMATSGKHESGLIDSGGNAYTQWLHLSEYAKERLTGNTTDEFTVSYDYDMSNVEASEGNTAVRITHQLNGGMGNVSWTNGIVPGSKGHYSYTFKLNATQADAENMFMGVRARINLAKKGGHYSISNVKLEAGSKETAWLPAPEDEQYTGIGGENLIKGTGEPKPFDKWTFLRATTSNGMIRLIPDNSDSNSYARYTMDNMPYGRYKNNYYTLSFDAKIRDAATYANEVPNLLAESASAKSATVPSGTSAAETGYWQFTNAGKTALTNNTSDYITISFMYQLRNATPDSSWAKDKVNIYAQMNGAAIGVADDWVWAGPNESGYFSYTTKLSANNATTPNLRFRIRYAATGAYLHVMGIKVTIGTKDTPWAPASTDSIYSYTEKPDRIHVYPMVITPERIRTVTGHSSTTEQYVDQSLPLVRDYEWHRYFMTFYNPDSLISGRTTGALVDTNLLTIQFGLNPKVLPLDIRHIKLEPGIQATAWSQDMEDAENVLNDIKASLQTQLDEKILTWAQAEDPAEAWTSVNLKAAHTGDLWYYTGATDKQLLDQSPQLTVKNNSTYKWNGSKWELHKASQDLFDTIDGKRQIFYGSPDDSYGSVDKEDLLIDKDGTTYKWVAPENEDPHWEQTSEIAVGGRNLLLWTGDMPIATSNDVSDKSGVCGWRTKFPTKTADGVRFNYTGSDQECIGFPLAINGSVSSGESIMLSFEARGNIDVAGHMFWIQESGGNVDLTGWLPEDVLDDLSATEWRKFAFGIPTTNANVRTCAKLLLFYNPLGSSGKWIELKKGTVKLEKGNRATDWSPAPEDTDAKIDSAQAQIDTLQPELIVGTHGTAATAAWTGTSAKLTEIVAGTRIQFKLSSAGVSPVTLNLTLKDGTTTGAKPVYFIGTTALGTQYKINAVVDLIYDGDAWRVLNPFTDTTTNYYDRTNYKAALAASEAIAATKLAVMGEDGKLKVLAASKFDVTCPILYVATAYSAANVTAGTTRATNYSMWGTPFNLATTKSGFTGAAGKSVYIVGTLSGKWFTPDTEVFTVTEPTTENGKAYMLLGTMSTATNAVLNAEHPIYQFIGGKFQRVDQAALTKVVALDTQTGIFNRLTDNGTVQGLFMEKVNGVNQLFVNMSYLKTGILRVGGEAIESVLFDGSVTVINNTEYDKKTLGAFHLVNEQRYTVVYDSVSYNLNCEYNDINEYYYIGDGWLIEDIPTAPPDPQFVIYEDTDGVRIKCTAAGTHTVKLITYEEKDTFYANAETGGVRINGDFESSNGNYTVSIKNALLDMVYSGNSIGSIGMGAFQFRPNNRGISFDLNAAGDFLAWRVNDGENWNYIMAYTRQAFGSFAANHLTFTENINLTNKAAQYVYNPQSAVDAFGRVAYNGTITINGTVYQVSNGMIFSRT